MPKTSADTALRYIRMLMLIPAYPDSISTRQLHERLIPDYQVTLRTVERDLNDRLSYRYPISCEQRGRSNHWFWTDRHALTQIPMMSRPTAFALRLAKDHLDPIIPPSVLASLQPYFRHADSILEGTDLGRWRDKSAVISQGPVLEAPNVPADVQNTVCLALMENRKIEAHYTARGEVRARPIELHPLGIVARAGVIYLVATAWNFTDVRQYALHRVTAVRPMEEPAKRPPDFELGAYIRDTEAFSYPVTEETLHFRALFNEGAARHLGESRLAPDQRLTAQDDGRVLVEATIKNNADLRWWLYGFGSAVEVLEPESLRREFKDETQRMAGLYD